LAAASSEACPLVGRPFALLEAMLMIVIGVDVDKHSLTGVAVDEGAGSSIR
jgi:hypothetical protein